MTAKQYQRHFTSILRKIKRQKRIVRVTEIVENSRLVLEDKKDIYKLWWIKWELEHLLPKGIRGSYDLRKV